jgi:hypothetical protein
MPAGGGVLVVCGVFCRASHPGAGWRRESSKRWGRETKIAIFSSRRGALGGARRGRLLPLANSEPNRPRKRFEVLRQNRKSEGLLKAA